MLAISPSTTASQGLLGFWSRLGRNQRIGLAGAAAAAVVVLGIFANMARTPEYAVAFSNLRDEDAAAIVAKLKEAKIPYELAERGTIKVQSSQVQEVKLLAAAAGLTGKGGNAVGMEIFSQPHFGLTEFAEKINYQRALEGELSRTINRLDAVETARVHLVLPEQSLFTSQKKEPTAAVVIQLKPGRRLDPGQVQGMTQLVAGSVEGLKTQNVTVMDTQGTTLSERGAEGDPARQSGNRGEMQRQIESRLAEDVRMMLNTVVGPDKSVVRVSAELDWDQYEANSETFSPNNKAPQVRSKRDISETSTQGTAAGGVPGTERNVPGYPGAGQAAGTQAGAERKDSTVNYELSKTVEKTVRAPGGIKRMNVAVALDSEVIADPAQADAISRLVATAAGLNTERGDLVTLTSLPFSPSAGKATSELAEAARQREFYFLLARLMAMVLGPLMVVVLLWTILRRGRKKPALAAITVSEPGADGQAALEGAAEAEALPQLNLPELPQPESPEQIEMKKQLTSMATEEPAMMAQLIRTMMHEDRGSK